MRKSVRNGFSAVAFAAVAMAAAPALSAGGVAWGYHGDLGPGDWGKLTDSHGAIAYPLCGEGKAQSPIDIAAKNKKSSKLSPIRFNYRAAPLKIKNNGHTIQVDYAKGSTATVNGESYSLLQFHFHRPSEHTVGGKSFPMEGHLVHAKGGGADMKLAVIGVLMVAGDHNPALQAIWKNMPKKKGTVTVKGKQVNAANLLPRNRGYFAYDGSLTTPPCSEGVKWHVLQQAIQVSPEQIEQFGALFHGGTARPVQALNGRAIRQ